MTTAYFRSKRNVVSDFRPNADWILSSFGQSAGVMMPGAVWDSRGTKHLPQECKPLMVNEVILNFQGRHGESIFMWIFNNISAGSVSYKVNMKTLYILLHLLAFRCVFWLLAVLAVFAVTVTLRAQEYEVDGTIDLKLNHPDKSAWKDYQGRFRVYVNGCAWLIELTETNDWGIPQRREVGTPDGKEVFEMVAPYEPLSPSDPVLVGATNMQIAPSGLLTSNAIPVGNLDSSFTGHLWLMFASGCYFRTATAPGQLTPVFNFCATPYMNNHMTMNASWELINGPGSLPSRVTYFDPDGTISAVYTATGFTNVGALKLPLGFQFSEPKTGYKEVSAVVTAVSPICSRTNFRPVITQKLTMTDLRWHPQNLGAGFTAYGADYWPTVEQAQKIYYSTRPAPKKVVATNSFPHSTNRMAVVEKMIRAKWPTSATPFASAILDHPGVKLPEQGPWTISIWRSQSADGSLIMDLVKHSDPMFLFLWNSLSNETKSAIEEERAK